MVVASQERGVGSKLPGAGWGGGGLGCTCTELVTEILDVGLEKKSLVLSLSGSRISGVSQNTLGCTRLLLDIAVVTPQQAFAMNQECPDMINGS